MAVTRPQPAALQQAVAVFLENLRSMATGSYLTEEDRQWWDPPYPPSAVDQIEQILTEMLAVVTQGGSAIEAATEGVSRMQRVSDACGGLILDTDELAELLDIVAVLAELSDEDVHLARETARKIVEE